MNFVHQLGVVIYIKGRNLEHILSICNVFIQQRSIRQNLLNVFFNMLSKNLYHIHLKNYSIFCSIGFIKSYSKSILYHILWSILYEIGLCVK